MKILCKCGNLIGVTQNDILIIKKKKRIIKCPLVKGITIQCEKCGIINEMKK